MCFRIIFLIGFFHYLIFSEAAVYLKILKLECKPNFEYFQNYSCYLKPVNRYKSMGFLQAYVKNSLKNITINVALYARNDVNIYKPYLINFTSNVCDLMDGKRSGIFLNTYKYILKTYTNLNHSCPYTGYLIVKNLHIDIEHVLYAPVPPNYYKFIVKFYEGYPLDYIGTVGFYVQIIEVKKQ